MAPWIRIRTETNADPQHWFFLIKRCAYARSDPRPASPIFIRFQVLLFDTIEYLAILFSNTIKTEKAFLSLTSIMD
jgi:hypothetical protein